MNFFRSLADLDNTYSAGETKLFIELQKRRLTIYMASHKKIALCFEKDGVHRCEPDFLWGPPGYAVFLDGEGVHKSEHRWRIDGLVKKALERKGYTVDRFRYRVPLSNKRCREIADAIEKRVR